MKFIFRNTLFLFNMIFVVGLGLAYISPYVDPNDFWPLAFFGLTFMAWLAANAFLLVFWLILKKKFWMYNLLILLVGIFSIPRALQLGNPAQSEGDLKVLFFNTEVLQVYSNGNTSEELNNYLVSNDFDFVALVEWFDKKGVISTKDYPFQQFVKLQSARNRYDYGLKVASKHKILHWERVDYGHVSDNMTAFFDVEVGEEVIRFVTTHLQSNSLGANDYHKFLEFSFDEESKEHAKNTVRTLRWCMSRRSIQTRKILEIIEDSPYPVIIMGDFNDTPHSFAYQQLSKGRKDCFMEKGSWTGATFLEPFPLLRIDYILSDTSFDCTAYRSHTAIESDHKIIEAEFTY